MNTTPETHGLEHDRSGGVNTKKVILYGWDLSGLNKKSIATDTYGNMLTGSPPMAVKTTPVGSITYVGIAQPGSSQASAVWQALKVDETSGTVVTWADGNANFDNIATDLTALTYS